MPLYFGLPISVEEASRLLKLNWDNLTEKIKQKKKYIHNFDYVEIINEYLKNKSKMELYYTDKGQCVIGFLIEEPFNVWTKFINVDEFLILLIKLKTQFQNEIQLLNIDLSKVTLNYMEGEQPVVNYPLPYILEWN